MAAPTAIQTVVIPYARVVNQNTRTSPTFNVLAGDLLVARATREDASAGTGLTISNNGTALTWTLRASITTGSQVGLWVWTAPIITDTVGLTVTLLDGVAATAGPSFGAHIKTWRNHGGVGVGGQGNGTTSASVTLTGAAANSAVDAVGGDWTALAATGTWSGTVVPTSEYAQVEPGAATYYQGSIADAGVAGNKTVTINIPGGTSTSVAAVEIKAGAGAPPVAPPRGTVVAQAITRAASR